MEFMYTATEFYELPDISPASWQSAVNRYQEFVQTPANSPLLSAVSRCLHCLFFFSRMAVDDEYFQQWFQMRTLNTGINGPCYGACKAEHLCELAAPTYGLFTQCVENNSPNNSTEPEECTEKKPLHMQ